MMRRISVLLAAVLAAGAVSAGQISLKSAELRLEGETRLDALFQDVDLNNYVHGVKRNSSFIDPTVSISARFRVRKQVVAGLQVRTPPYLRDYLGSRSWIFQDAVTGEQIHYPGRIFEVSQIYLEANQFYKWPNVSLTIGVKNMSYRLTEHGAFFLALGESEDPFEGDVCANWPVNRGGTAVYSNRASFNAPGRAGSVEAGGFVVSYKGKMNIAEKSENKVYYKIDFFCMTTYETLYLNQDRDVIGLMADVNYPTEKDSNLRVLAGLVSMSQNANSRIYSIGGGFAFKATRALRIYGEAWGQTGEFCEGFTRPPAGDPYHWLATRDGTVTQQAFAGYLGGRYEMRSKGDDGSLMAKWRPYLDFSYWWVGGDKSPHDMRNQDFIAYEAVDSTLIMEEGRYGLDMDTNYEAVKLIAGFHPWKEVQAWVTLANFRRARDYTAKDRLGREIDVQVKWQYTGDLAFRFGMGFVVQSDYMLGDDSSRKTFSTALLQVVLRF